MKKKFIFIIFIVVIYSCENKSQTTPLEFTANLPKKLKEISGIAYNNHLIYAIEDSGNDNEVLVLDTLGSITKKITINNVENIDWEDLTFDKTGNLYIGDFGNNDNTRTDLSIYKINQADLQNEEATVSYKISFEYPEQTEFPPKKKDLKFDVEAFFEHENSFYLFTKNRSKNFDGSSFVYKIPNIAGHHKAELINTITTCSDYDNCVVTSAAISPDGTKFILLSHSQLFVFENFNKNLKNGTMTAIDLKHYSQKEAICFINNELIFIADEVSNKNGGDLFKLNLRLFQTHL